MNGTRGVGRTILHSLWVIPVLLGMGVLSWTGLAYVAARTRRPSWLVAAGVTFVMAAVCVALLEPADAPGSDSSLAGGLLILTWGLASVAAFVMLPGYLRWHDERAGHRVGTVAASGPASVQDRPRPGTARFPGGHDGGDLPVIDTDR